MMQTMMQLSLTAARSEPTLQPKPLAWQGSKSRRVHKLSRQFCVRRKQGFVILSQPQLLWRRCLANQRLTMTTAPFLLKTANKQ